MALTAEQTAFFRSRLVSERGRILADVASLDAEVAELGQEHHAEGGGAGNHLADDASEMVEQERDLALIGNLQERLREIDHALARVEAGTYGNCERCGNAISSERLEVLPFASHCITCKALLDRQRRPFMA